MNVTEPMQCMFDHPHSPHAWDFEDRAVLRYQCDGWPAEESA